jgi:hypothetical protein
MAILAVCHQCRRRRFEVMDDEWNQLEIEPDALGFLKPNSCLSQSP